MADDNGVDAGLVRELAEILKANDLAEIEVEADDVHIRLSRAVAAAPVMAAPAPAPGPVSPAVQSAAPHDTQPAQQAAPGRSGGDTIASPMVGTAYLSPTPGAAAFVSEGKTVKEGDTLLIIEAMKVMNAIPAPRSGTIVEIMCENGQPVEFDQPLMIIE